MSSEGEEKRRSRKSEYTLTDFDVKIKLSELEGMLSETLYIVDTIFDKLDRMEKRFIKRAARKSDDMLVLVFIILMVLANPSVKLNITNEKVRKAVEECRKSKEPEKCVENVLRGG